MTDGRRTIGFNPLDPRDRIERGKERAAWFRRADMMGAVALAMAVFTALALTRRELAMAYLLAMMLLPLLITLALILLNAAARRSGRAEPVSHRPRPVSLVAISTGLFLVLADPLSPVGAAGFVILVIVGWIVVRRQASGAAGHG